MSVQPSRQGVIAALVAHLEKERAVYERIAEQARLDAIDGEMKQEGKYDTRAIEASYLAGAQKRRLEEIIIEIQSLKALPSVNLEGADVITIGSLVQMESASGTHQWYFISPLSGGLDVEESGGVKVVSSKSPIAQALFGLALGEEPTREPLPATLKRATVSEIL
ncbi:MAG TPA: transcription elongation factor GreAB [Bdellovibrionota bacterium]|jgi:transcription elongation GreA/GreB family factor|nr:transcription elongation factor GreAB [Bdellovibrionota bacterium]